MVAKLLMYDFLRYQIEKEKKVNNKKVYVKDYCL